MSVSIIMLLFSLCYCGFLNIIYMVKKHIATKENHLFRIILFTNLLGIIAELICSMSIKYFGAESIIALLTTKLFLIYLISFPFIMFLYIVLISLAGKNNSSESAIIDKYKKYRKYILIIDVICCLISVILPTEIYSQNNIMYSYGMSSNFVYLVSAIVIAVSLIIMISSKQSIFKNKKYIPLFAYVIGGGITAFVQNMNPALTLATSMETFIVFLMYFTIENPDMAMIEELNVAKDAADKANQAKSDFLSSMSHEIRTPLNAIVGFSQALSEEELDEKAQDEVKDIMIASENLLEIVNGILDISKIESGKLEIVNKDYSFKKIYNDVVTLARGRLGEKPLEFRTYYDESIPPVLYGDYSRIKEIMINLLTNAIKYTNEGFIEFRISSVIKDDVCRIIMSVEDSGIGIKQENISKLFSKFERFDLDKNVTIEGTGLGLAITKKLIELMNGQIVVQSIYGKGSKFTVSLDQSIAIGHKLEDTASLDLANLSLIDFSNKKVLIVDDNKINLKVAARLLDDYKIQIEEVSSGQECLDKIKSGNRYDLILLDDMMPRMSGVETLKNLKEIPGFNIKTVALTANAITGMREKYLADGFDEYLAKPIEKKELAKIIQKMLGN